MSRGPRGPEGFGATGGRELRRLAVINMAATMAVPGPSFAGGAETAPTPRTSPGRAPAKKPPANNLEFWLGRAKPAASQPAKKGPEEVNPFRKKGRPARPDALPGVIEISDGTILPGYLYTTREKPLVVWVEQERRFRRIPFILVLSITAVVVEEEMVQESRWKGMGEPERVYTGREYPTRRFFWRFHLIDGTYITGAVKGQPIWGSLGGKKFGPLVLHERSKGPMGQKLSDLTYMKRIIVSRRMMKKVLIATGKDAAEAPAAAGKAKK